MLACLRASKTRASEAEALFQRAQTGYRASVGDRNPRLAMALLWHAEFLLEKNPAEDRHPAEPLLEEAAAILSTEPEANRYSIALLDSARAEPLLRSGRLEETLRLLESSLEMLGGAQTGSPHRLRAERRLARARSADS